MPIYALVDDLVFPDPLRADPSGVLAIGGDLSPQRLAVAYNLGIFPWPCDDLPLMWHSPSLRFVLPLSQLRINRTLAKVLKRKTFRITLDMAFAQVIRACQATPRPGQDGTWITEEVVTGYRGLHQMGLAHSVEAWLGDELVGGLYGVHVGGCFTGESMFARQDDASKVAFVTLARQLQRWGGTMVDCQVFTPHFEALGATLWLRRKFLSELAQCRRLQFPQGPWALDADLAAGATW